MVNVMRRPEINRRIVGLIAASLLPVLVLLATHSVSLGQASQAQQDKAGWDRLVEQAKNSNHRVRWNQPVLAPEVAKGLESAFKERFGFPLILELDPGQPGRNTADKVRVAHPAGRGAVDVMMWQSLLYSGNLFELGVLMRPDWNALAAGYPMIQGLRKHIDEIIDVTFTDGSSIGDYCVYDGTSTFGFAYHKGRVSDADIKGLTWKDLVTSKWANRVAINIGGNIGKVGLVYGKDWIVDWIRMARKQGTLNPEGGSRGVIQAILSGEADIGLVSWPAVGAQIEAGAPIGYTFTEVVPSAHTFWCIPAITVNDPAMAQLFTVWYNVAGESVREPLDRSTTKIFPGINNRQAEFLAERGLTIKDTVDIVMAKQTDELRDIVEAIEQVWFGR